MRVSVVIPAYNEALYIENTLLCLKNQTFKDFDIVVADNNSTDDTASISKAYGARVLNVKKQGAVFAYNAGMHQCAGDIIVNIDADTQPPNNWLEIIVDAMNDDSVVAVTGSAEVKTNSRIINILIRELFTLFIQINFLIGKPHVSGFNFAVKRSAFTKVGGMDEKYRMSFEVDLGLRLSTVGKVIFLKDLTVLTSTRRWKKDKIKAFIEYTKGYIYTVWLRKPPPFKQIVIR